MAATFGLGKQSAPACQQNAVAVPRPNGGLSQYFTLKCATKLISNFVLQSGKFDETLAYTPLGSSGSCRDEGADGEHHLQAGERVTIRST